MSRIFLRLPLLLSAFSLPGIAWSQSLTGNVGSAGITSGDRSIELRTGIDDTGTLASRLHYDQALTGWYQFRVIAAFEKPDGASMEYNGVTLENWLQWSEEGDDGSGLNAGARLSYTVSEGTEPDEAEIRLTLTDRFSEGWEWRANAIGEIETGSGGEEGVGLETRLQLSRATRLNWLASTNWRVGGELFSEYGNTRDIPGLQDQAHQAGPILKTSWDNGVYLQAGLRRGLTRGADDWMGKLFIGREF